MVFDKILHMKNRVLQVGIRLLFVACVPVTTSLLAQDADQPFRTLHPPARHHQRAPAQLAGDPARFLPPAGPEEDA